MGAKKTAWHVLFGRLLTERAPPDIEVHDEITLSHEPQRMDFLLLRRKGPTRRDHEARVLRGLWPLLQSRDAIMEFKSAVRPATKGDLIRLVGYGAQYQVSQIRRLPRRTDLTLVAVMPAINKPVRDEIAAMGWTLHPLGSGYHELLGVMYPTSLAEVRKISKVERDELLKLFGYRRIIGSLSRETWWWWRRQVAGEGAKMQEHEDFDEMLDSFLATLPPERLVRKLSAEERLLTLPDAALAALSDEYLDTLPQDVREVIRKRIGR